MNYTIKKNEGCADYGKVSLEGEIYGVNKEELYNILKTEFISVNNIAEGKIIIAKNENLEMYLYDESRFIVSKLKSEEYGIEVLNKMFK